jgi:hypothetical protein
MSKRTYRCFMHGDHEIHGCVFECPVCKRQEFRELYAKRIKEDIEANERSQGSAGTP